MHGSHGPARVVYYEVVQCTRSIMPRKKRDIRRDYRRAGFSERKGKGDHTVFAHPLLDAEASVDGHDGDDAHHYDERTLRRLLEKLRQVET